MTDQMITDTNISLISAFLFLGIFLGLILSYFFLKNGFKKNTANVYQGLLMLTLSMGMLEEFLNETGYIVQVLGISNFAEPFNLAYAQLFYLFIKRSLIPQFKKQDLLHFIPFLIWVGNMMFYFTLSPEFKYNSYIDAKHPDWPFLDIMPSHVEDPLGIREYANLVLFISFIVYMIFSIFTLLRECNKMGVSIWKTENNKISGLKNINIHFIIIISIFIIVKLKFEGDLGDYFISAYITFMFLLTSIKIMESSTYFDENISFMDLPMRKYKKSSLTGTDKENILVKIETEMKQKKYFLNNLASLEDLSNIIKVSKHHVSQVINEQTGMNFFELLAKYRVEEAKKILLEDKERKITIEDLADTVGYNSKSSLNKAFKHLTGMTPSEFRDRSDKK